MADKFINSTITVRQMTVEEAGLIISDEVLTEIGELLTPHEQRIYFIEHVLGIFVLHVKELNDGGLFSVNGFRADTLEEAKAFAIECGKIMAAQGLPPIAAGAVRVDPMAKGMNC